MNAWRERGGGGQAKRAWREKREGEKRKTKRKGDSERGEMYTLCARCLAAVRRRRWEKNGDGGRVRKRDRREEGKNAFVDCSIE